MATSDRTWPFDAFVSYSHDADEFLANEVRKAIQTLGRPFWRWRRRRVFLDRSALEISSDLDASLYEAIDNSEHLVFLASPQSAESTYVGHELTHFLSRAGSEERLLIVLTAGDLEWDDDAGRFDQEQSTSLPAALHEFTTKPHWLDVRWAAEGVERGRRQDLKLALASVVAAVQGVSKDRVLGADRRLQRGYGTAVTIAALVVSLLAVLAFRAQQEAETNATLARSQALASLGVSESSNRLDQALLLARAGRRVAATDESYRGMFTVLSGTGPVQQFQHDLPGPMRSVRASDDGRILAMGGNGGEIVIRSADLEPPLTVLETDGGPVREIVIDSERALAVAASHDGTIRLIDLDSEELVTARVVGDGEIRGLTFDGERNRLFVGGFDGIVRVLSWPDLEVVDRIDQLGMDHIHSLAWVYDPTGPSEGGSPAGHLVIGGRERLLNAGLGLGRVVVIEPNTKKILADTLDLASKYGLQTLEGSLIELGTVPSVATSPRHEATVAFTTFSGALLVWSYLQDDIPTVIGSQDKQLNRVRFDPSGRWMATAGFDHSVQLYRSDGSWEPWGEPLDHHGSEIWDLAFLEGSRLLTVSDEGTVAVISVGKRTPPFGRIVRSGPIPDIRLVELQGRNPLLAVPRGSTVESIDIGEHEMASAGMLASSFPRAADERGETQIIALDFDRQGGRFAVAHKNGAIEIVGVAETDSTQVLQSSLVPRVVAFHPTEAILAVGGDPISADVTGAETGAIEFWSLETFELRTERIDDLAATSVFGLAFSGDGRRLLVSGSPYEQSLRSWPELRILGSDPELPLTRANDGAFAPDGQTAVATDGQFVALLSPEGTLEARLPEHEEIVLALAFTADGTRLASGSKDGAVILWDLVDRVAALGPPLLGHESPVRDLVFSADGLKLYSSSGSELIEWNLDANAWDDFACSIANRELTESEWRRLVGEVQQPMSVCG